MPNHAKALIFLFLLRSGVVVMSEAMKPASLPLLFTKRRSVDRSLAQQYVGTTTELDIK